MIAVVAHVGNLAATLPAFALTKSSIIIALAIVTDLGPSILLPSEARIYLEMVSTEPDLNEIRYYGMYNAKRSAIQVFQLAIIVVMVYIRWGGF
ncbi:hypothetical protein [Halomontanus rarus]|uniref:hypothetical protein n=1 Tax=Halomontanus rarus TaxID=3034020 RepID=UPI0023E78A6E|nr:hypothetical protein [Halovivax sp. TS33]